ncbi:MAG TPA: response regulator [Polyangiaceae bacterium]
MSTTLLAVDDSKTMRKVLEITFASEDYRTLLAANADEALQLVRAEGPKVAVVDAGLGGMSGYELCQQIKAQAPGTAVLVLSSKQQPYDRGRGSAAGADDFMDKPFDTQQLLDKVKALAKNAEARAAAAPSPVAAAPPPVAAPPPHVAAAPPPAPSAPAMAAPRAQTLAYGSPTEASPKPPGVRPAVPRGSTTSPGLAPIPAAAAVAHAISDNGQLAGKLGQLGLSNEQVQAVLALSRDVVERVVWEVVPALAETLIKEEIQRLTSD